MSLRTGAHTGSAICSHGGDSLLSQERLYKLISLCGGIFAAAICAAMAMSSLDGNYGSQLFSGALLLLIFMAACMVLTKWPLFSSPADSLLAMGLLFCGLCLRYAMFDHISGDYVSFLSVWTDTMGDMTVREALSTPIGDYNMPYLYVILLISRLPFYDLYCIKLFSVLADAAVALAVGYLAKLLTDRPLPVLLAFAAALFCPTTWLNSAYWGQCDSVYCAFAMWGLYCALSRKPVWSMVLFALSLAFKLQAIFILPIVAFLLVTSRVELKHILAFPLGFLGAMVPALLGGRSFQDTFSIYIHQTNAYPYLSLNAPSFWSLIHNDYFHAMSSAPVLLALVLTLVAVLVFLRQYPRLDTAALVELALIFSLLIPWSLPKMHERYFYLAEILSILYVVIHPGRLAVAVVILFGGFLIYSAYLFGSIPVLSLQYIAVIYGLVILYLMVRCNRELTCCEQLKGDIPHGKL